MHGREAEVSVTVDDFLPLVQTCKNKRKWRQNASYFFSFISVAHLEDDPEGATSTYSPELSHKIITGRTELQKSIH